MALIRGGVFQMGTATGGEPEERPVHEVQVSSFYLDRTEVTVGAYAVCVRAGRCSAPDPANSMNWNVSGRRNHPVDAVSWEDARTYCEWVGKRLPTEGEWEYAARGSGGRTYPWGDDAPSDERLRWGGGGGNGTRPVQSYPHGATPESVHDLSGNVWEWVADWYGAYPSTRQSDPQGPTSGQERVVRGGSWFEDDPSQLRAATRDAIVPSAHYYHVGFRCARAI
jgi:formylglycine-generating enzyme required for sulfatase activity